MPDKPPLTLEELRALPPDEQRRLVADDWPRVVAALRGGGPRTLTADELASMTLDELRGLSVEEINANWSTVAGELARRADEPESEGGTQ